jgi:hypothetical protein
MHTSFLAHLILNATQENPIRNEMVSFCVPDDARSSHCTILSSLQARGTGHACAMKQLRHLFLANSTARLNQLILNATAKTDTTFRLQVL